MDCQLLLEKNQIPPFFLQNNQVLVEKGFKVVLCCKFYKANGSEGEK